MDEIFGRLGEVKLRVAAQPRVIIEDGEEVGLLPAAVRSEDGDTLRGVKVEVPERADVIDLVAANFAFLEPRTCALDTGPLSARTLLSEETDRIHVTHKARIGGQWAEREIFVDDYAEIVVVEPTSPVGVSRVLCSCSLIKGGTDGATAAEVTANART